jgi:PAS domain S-box-containing protein
MVAKKALDEARARLVAIVESSDDAIISKDLDGVITSWNGGAERLFGYTPAEAIGRTVSSLLIPRERHDEEPGILERVRRGERIDHYETVRRRKDGTHIAISLTVSPIRDDQGTVVGASKIARDITERQEAAARAAREQETTGRLYDIGQLSVRPEEPFEQVLAGILDAAMWMTGAPMGALQRYDEQAARLDPVAHRGLSGACVEFFARVGHGDAAACGTALVTRERVIVEDVRTSPIFAGQPSLQVLLDAGIRAIETTPLLGSTGAVLGMLSTMHAEPHRSNERDRHLLDVLARQASDYLERKRNERQREELLRITERAREEAETANRAKDEFLAMLGHELRNPLSAVHNAIMVASRDPERGARALEIARRQTEQLTRIVDDLLDVSRITHGRVPLRRARVSIVDVVQRAAEASRALMDERGHRLVLAVAEDAHVDADAARLEQAVGNLLSNAAKYTEPGGTVTVTTGREGDAAIIRVRDDGLGIAPDVLPRVFDLFTQGARSLARAEGGLGIGLTVVRRVIELHGGTVTASSGGLGAGAEFVIRLPALRGDAPPADRREAHAAATPLASSGASVLVVEDNADAAESLRMVLELLGHRVQVAHDGHAGLEAARADIPDVMLIDIGLPTMTGYEIAKAVRRDPALRSVALVALTGYGQSEDKAEAAQAGFDRHLVKPVNAATLGDLVAELAYTQR